MTDRELLEMAAKAAGHSEVSFEDGVEARINGWWSPWNPLTDDGDALRLAVSLNLCVQPACSDDYDRAYAAAYLFDDCGREVISVREVYEVDSQSRSATRRAIVRAAAAIGSAM